MKGVMRREKRRGGLIERMRGVGAERIDGRRVGRRGKVWAEIRTQMMSFSLYHGNLRNAFSKPQARASVEGGEERHLQFSILKKNLEAQNLIFSLLLHSIKHEAGSSDAH